MIKRTFMGVALCMVLTACMEGGFQSNYRPALLAQDQNFSPCSGDPRVERFPRGTDEQIIKAMESKGYVLIGDASWTGPANEDSYSAQSQGKNVGACLVLWGREEVGQRQVTRAVNIHTPAERIVITEKHRHGKTVEKVIEKPARNETQYVQDTVTDYRYKGLFFARAIRPVSFEQ